ncbi:MAG: hypothetical protein KBC41_01505 [Candidatus Pacebacteria bacterium]|nr:hypothetical protein [Candidatus Paceibacterota bacterium]
MKKIILSVSILLSCCFNLYAENASTTDKEKVMEKMEIFDKAINQGDVSKVQSLISSSNTNLQIAVKDRIRYPIKFNFYVSSADEDVQAISPNVFKYVGAFDAKTDEIEIKNFPVYFTFEKTTNGEFFIVDTDFVDKLNSGPGDVVNEVFSQANIQDVDNFFKNSKHFLVIFILLIFFWLFMFNDCLKRDFENKWLWVLSFIIGSIATAFLYYFTIKKKDIDQNSSSKQDLKNISSEEGLTVKEKTVLIFLSLFILGLPGAIMYYVWRKKYPTKAEQAKHISRVTLFILFVISIFILIKISP